MGENSFRDYSGEFELKNLPKLSTIKIGEIGYDSYNFYCSSFVIKDLPHLNSIELGYAAFHDSLSTMISNLPPLKSNKHLINALRGSTYDSSWSMIMENLPNQTSIM